MNQETLTILDLLEGYPQWYTRTEEEVTLENGQTIVGKSIFFFFSFSFLFSSLSFFLLSPSLLSHASI